MLDEAHLGAWLDAQFSTKPGWNDNPTPRCYIDKIHDSSLLKNASDSHDISREPAAHQYILRLYDLIDLLLKFCN